MSKPKRKAVSTRTRFEIFKRDGFKCLYCGATPVDGALHVDHVRPVAEGGTNDPANLVTSCAPCNGGKSSVPLEKRRFASGKATESDLEHAEQIRGWLEVQRQVLDAKGEVQDELISVWERFCGPAPRDLRSRLPRMLERFPVHRLVEAFEVVGSQGPTGRTDQLRYLYGVLRRWEGEGAKVEPAWSTHAQRCMREVLRALSARTHGDIETRRWVAAEAFVRAAWGSEMDLNEGPRWFSTSGDIPLGVRGILLWCRQGVFAVEDVPGFDPQAFAWGELNGEISVAYGPPDEDAWPALHSVAMLSRELRLWLDLRTNPDATPDWLGEHPVLKTRWVME